MKESKTLTKGSTTFTLSKAHINIFSVVLFVIRTVVGTFVITKAVSERHKNPSISAATNSWHAVAISFERPNWVHLLQLLESI